MVNKEIVTEYEMNPSTLAILPIQYGSKLYSKIYQAEDEVYSPFKPTELIKIGCRLYASSYEGRKDGSKKLIGSLHKIPITIDPTSLMYFFPTTSPSNSHCAWISHEYVYHYEKVDSTNTLVTFRNKRSIIIPISCHSFEKQMLRTALLRTKLAQRISPYNRQSMVLYQGYSKASEHIPTYGDISHKKRMSPNKFELE